MPRGFESMAAWADAVVGVANIALWLSGRVKATVCACCMAVRGSGVRRQPALMLLVVAMVLAAEASVDDGVAAWGVVDGGTVEEIDGVAVGFS